MHHHIWNRRALSVSFLMLYLSGGNAAYGAAYTILDLGGFGGSSSTARSISSNGLITGFSDTSGNNGAHAFRTAAYSASKTDLGTHGGDHDSYGYGINSSGVVVGQSQNVTLQSTSNTGFKTTATGTAATASTFGAGGANRILDSGVAVGYITISSTQDHAFRASATGVVSDLGTLGGNSSYAYGVNSSGVVVGQSYVAGNVFQQAFRTQPNAAINPATDNLGTFGGDYSLATDINTAGQVVGNAKLPGNTVGHAFRTQPNAVLNALTDDLGTLGGDQAIAWAINATGQTVGTSYTSGITNSHAFFVDTTGGMQDLNNLIPAGSGWVLTTAWDINDSGYIVGEGTFGGAQHAFLLTPTPEPGCLALLGLGGLAHMRRRRSNATT